MIFQSNAQKAGNKTAFCFFEHYSKKPKIAYANADGNYNRSDSDSVVIFQISENSLIHKGKAVRMRSRNR